MAKKIKLYRRKDLVQEPDEFLTFSESAFEWSKTNWPLLIIAVGVIMVAGLVGLLIKSSIANSRQEFQSSFQEAINTLQAPIEGQGKPTPGQTIFPDEKQKYEAIVFKFDKLLKEHANSNLAPYMRLYIADAHVKLGQIDTAIPEYQVIQKLPGAGDIKIIARNNEGIAYFLQKKYDLAYPILKEIADSTSTIDKASALVYAGRCADFMHKPDEAIKYYQKAVDSYSDSILVGGLKERVALIKMTLNSPPKTEEIKPKPEQSTTRENP